MENQKKLIVNYHYCVSEEQNPYLAPTSIKPDVFRKHLDQLSNQSKNNVSKILNQTNNKLAKEIEKNYIINNSNKEIKKRNNSIIGTKVNEIKENKNIDN